ncbi:MAG: thioredoxin domain-containing protein [Firmicutes bacterium HGW-Firmicutes-15]|nr:MAG: thioredoxin domain-containing protein [Firmicutes bacterium HGW-Firmicutes-15]
MSLDLDRKANRLITEKSPYLLQHAYNPVDWYPWGKEAFEKAKSKDTPIFLSIGYSTCHWCHVMEKESFEDSVVANLLNQDFVCIKVDREERPDIDHIYMQVCQALTGSGGWPLTIIMTPERHPFYAATYLPPLSRGGMPGLLELLPRLSQLWKNDRETALNAGQEVSNLIKITPRVKTGIQLSEEVFIRAFKQYEQAFDSAYGGFGSAPKFPTPHTLLFLLKYYELHREKKALQMVEKTLLSMYQGGIYDHIGFGFSRYSTDRKWLVPHFEKMLYDNALLAMSYLEADRITGSHFYGRVAGEIFTYILRDMTSPEGGFYSAEDADSEGEEGKFYAWSPDEVMHVLGPRGAHYCEMYDITDAGNFEGRSIPNLVKNIRVTDARAELEQERQALFAHREKRVKPHKDDKILSSWNGLMIAALAMGYRIIKDERYLQAAERAADFVLRKLRREDGRLLARYREGEALYPAYAADYAYLIWGLIELHEAGSDSRYLKAAQELNNDLLKLFWDKEKGGLFFYGEDSEKLLIRPKEVYDGAMPSDNAVATSNFLRLGRMTGNANLEERVRDQFLLFAGTINENPTAYAFWLLVALNQRQTGLRIVL